MRTLILGLGNPILKDDAVGIKVARTIEGRVKSPHITVQEASIAGLELLETIQGFDKVVLIDSIKLKGARPGEVLSLDIGKFESTIRLSSPHDINFATALELGKKLGLAMPGDIRIYAIQVEDVFTFDETCSPLIEQSIPRFADHIMKKEAITG